MKTRQAGTWGGGFLCAVFLVVAQRPLEAGPSVSLSASYLHNCAVTTGAGVVCWGWNPFGQLGDGTTVSRSTPVAVHGLASGVTAVAAGAGHTCALTSGGGVRCWGMNGFGQLGDGTTVNRSRPVAVHGLASGVTAIAAGGDHTCALTSSGGVVCWGRNYEGALGDGTTTVSRSTPAPVSGLPSGVAAVAAGGSHTCALTNSGGVLCWGLNRDGELGDGTTASRNTPVAVSGLASGVTSVAAGAAHTCALTSGGAAVCWGRNDQWQLGDGTGATVNRSTPVAVSGLASGVTAIAPGVYHTCALTSGGGVACWGLNRDGELGDGTTASRNTPVVVVGLSSGVAAVATGNTHTCALTSGGGVRCWGYNLNGELGDGTMMNRLTPVVTVSTLLSPSTLSFAAISSGSAFTSQTAAQTVRLSQTGTGPFTWTATSSNPWLTVTPASGSGPTLLSVAVRFDTGVSAAGNAIGTIAVSVTGAGTDVVPVTVRLNVVSSSAPVSPPFGAFDTPAGDSTVLAGSIALTGWTLDNVGVTRVELWRDLQAGETTPPFASTASDPRTGKVFIANATFVGGARPDVEALNPTTPFNDRAGWGYLLLTWGLWNQGNGTYKLYAFGVDQENNISTIGSKTIGVSNTTATKPFGSIDTPTIGGSPVVGDPNFGWGLTPKVNGVATCKVPSNGVQVSIDSGPLQPVVYGDARADIAGAFPGFSNSSAAGGHFIFDWSTLANGAHTIGWLVTDDCGRADGIGSRFFTVSTGANVVTAEAESVGATALRAVARPSTLRESDAPITVAKGYGELPLVVDPGLAGSRTIEVSQGERIEVRLPRGFDTMYQLGPAGQPRALPIGATWDAASGTFYWQPAAGFLGRYRMVFTNGTERINVRVVVVP